jgi:hypothetical protein
MPVSSVVRAQTIAGSPQIIKTYVGGLFTDYPSAGSIKFNKFISLQPTGSVNTSFNPGDNNYFSGDTMSAVTVNSIAVQSDGKIIVGGNFKYYITSTSAYTSTNLIRLNTDGSVDSIYKGPFNAPINTVAVDYSGKTIVGGEFTTYSGVNYNRIIRFNSDTTVDTTFANPDPGIFDNDVNVIVPTPLHKFEVGSGYTYLVGGKIKNLMIELDYDGNPLINNFKTFTGTSVNTIGLNTILLFEDDILEGKYQVYIGGAFSGYSNSEFNCIVSTNAYGAAQPTFSGSSNGFNKEVRSIVVHPDNKLLVGGMFQTFSGVNNSDYFIILKTDGTPLVKVYDFNGYVNTIELDCCGKFLVGGEFTSVFSTTVNYITRFKPDGGQLDGTFVSQGFNNFVKTIYYSKT